MKEYAVVVIVILSAFLLALLVNSGLEALQANSVCKAFGWHHGIYSLVDGSICEQIVITQCSVDDVIAGNCLQLDDKEK